MKTTTFILCLIALTSNVNFAQAKADDPLLSTDNPYDKTRRMLPPQEIEQINAAFISSTKSVESARKLFARKKYREAEAECQRAIAIAPKISGVGVDNMPANTSALILLGEIYLAQGRNR